MKMKAETIGCKH